MSEGGEIYEDFRFFLIEQLKQPVLLKYDMNLLVPVAVIPFSDVQGIGRRTGNIPSDTNHFSRICLFQKVGSGMYRENTAASEQNIGFQDALTFKSSYEIEILRANANSIKPAESLRALNPLGINFQDRPMVVPRITRLTQDFDPVARFSISAGGEHPVLE
jgi:hypothetical protein